MRKENPGNVVEEEIINVGETVDLVAQKGRVFRTKIEDRLDNGAFFMSIPSRGGIPMLVHQDDDLYLVFYRESGRYITQMKVAAIEKRGEIRYMWLSQRTKPQKDQRREAYRVPIRFDVQIYEYADEIEQSLLQKADEAEAVTLEAVSSRDISITGIALMTKKEYELESNYILKLYVDGAPMAEKRRIALNKEPPLHVTARVMRCIPWRDSKMFNVGMQFFGMTKQMSEQISRYVLTEQQKQIQRRRLFAD
jgi:c-di-GMP-binding flagellar brake protein YcgR